MTPLSPWPYVTLALSHLGPLSPWPSLTLALSHFGLLSPAGLRGRVLSEEQFSCSICLEVFVEPVSTPCGHSFCKACLQGYWNHSKKFVCPMCKKGYHKKPELSVNRVLAEIATQFQGLMADGGGGGADGGGLGAAAGSTLTLGSPERTEGVGHVGSPGPEGGDFARAGEVPCDSCIGRKIKAKKSCLNCPGSYCEVHLKHHKKVKSLASHRLIEPVFHLEEKICKKHQRLLEAYCRHDHACICISCGDAAHKSHEIVSLDREWKKKMNNLGKRKSELKHLIKDRAKMLEEIKQSIKVIKTSAQRELEDSWLVYADLQRLVEQSQAELVEMIAARQREAERQAQELARGLENELSLLRRRSSELDALAQTQDKVLFLQGFPGLPPHPEPSDWSGVSVNTDLYLGSIRSSVGTLIDKFQEELKRLYGKELRKLQNYSSEVILDSATAQRDLVLSEDGHQVKYEERKPAAGPSEGPQRFSPALFVLGREGLTSGRHYWEVDTARKAAWTLGVARGSARRKGEIKLSPDGGFWCLWLKGGEIKALASVRLPLPLASAPAKVGVFLDYEAGEVAFYDVKGRQHLYTFHDTFGESLYPIFSPCLNQEGKNAAPLVIHPVKHGFVIVLKMSLRLRHVGMASSNRRSTGNLSEEQVHCSICLDVFTNPVSIPCGHNFCQACILGYWKTSPLYQCPMCKKTFYKRPDISINTVLREIAEQFKEVRVRNAQREQQEELTEVFCDVCLGEEGRPRAVKSCLVCLTSYCEEHLRSHCARFSKHKLMEPVANLEDRMCPKHERLLELYCKKDQRCVCVLCAETDHRAHYTVPVEREWMEKKVQLQRAEVDVQQMIQARLLKVEEIKQSVELNEASTQREIEEGVHLFAELVRSLQRSQAELVLAMEEKQRETESRALGLIAQLEQEIAELNKRNADLGHLSHSDHIHFLQSFPALSVPPPTKDWSETSVHTELCVGIIRRAVSKLEDILTEQIDNLVESELKKIHKYTVGLTLDPDTANPWLQLSEDRRQVRHLGAWQDLPDNPERFDTVVIVLGREGFASGRHYWEVQVGHKDDWYLGVARASVKRKGRIAVSVTQGYWALAMKKGGAEYRASTAPPLQLSLDSKPGRVGVYVDCEEGQVSFYDVEARSHIYTFTDRFRDKIYPFFYLYCCDKASDSMVIRPVIDNALTKQC
ncbi:bloodthirsty-related gene family, member 12 [Aplochiton taeniatus]